MEVLDQPCHSEASDISATSEESPVKNDKMKEKEEEVEGSASEHGTSSRIALDLKLSNDELKSKGTYLNSKLELNLFNSSDARENSNEGNPKPSEPKTFTCNFCRREFSTSQALGGHQNAHKQERALAKHRHSVVDMTAAAAPPPYGHLGYPYSSYHQMPFYGSSFNRSSPLGVRAESMIHKPYSYHTTHAWSSSHSPPFAYRLGREKMSRSYMISPPSSTLYDGLRMENFLQSHKTSGSGLGLNLGVNSNPNPNPNPTIVESASKGNNNQGLRLVNVDDGNDDAPGLDLNLKL